MPRHLEGVHDRRTSLRRCVCICIPCALAITVAFAFAFAVAFAFAFAVAFAFAFAVVFVEAGFVRLPRVSRRLSFAIHSCHDDVKTGARCRTF
jgi:uncharacterized protein (DUF58 family)